MAKNKYAKAKEVDFICRNQDSLKNLKNIPLIRDALFNIFFIFANKTRIDSKRLKEAQKSIDKKMLDLNNEYVNFYKEKLDYIDEDDFIKVMEANEFKTESFEYVPQSFGRFSGLFFRLDRCFCLLDYLWIDEEIHVKERDKKKNEFQRKYNRVAYSILLSNRMILETLESHKEEYKKKKNGR